MVFLTGPPAEIKRICLMFGMNFWPEMGMLAIPCTPPSLTAKGVW
jgi:hypothetical protein